MNQSSTAKLASGLLSPVEFDHYYAHFADACGVADGRFALFTTAGNRCFTSEKAAEIRDKAMMWAAQGKPVYGHIHLHRLPLGEYSLRGRIETVSVAIGLFSDIDARGPRRKKSPELLCPTVADAIGVGEEFGQTIAPVSLIINSGYGGYVFTGFREPFVIESEADRRRLEAIGRRYHDALHRIAARFGWTGAVDYCDPAKVIRVPGTVNNKDEANTKPVRIVHESPARYNIGDLEDLLPEIDGPKLFALQATGPAAPTHKESVGPKVTDQSGLTEQFRVEPPPKVVIDALLENDLTFKRTWNYERVDLRDQTCSGYDMALANIGVASCLSDSAIAGLLVENRRRYPRLKQWRKGDTYRKYIARTIAKARGTRPSPIPLTFDDSDCHPNGAQSGAWGGSRG